MVFNAFLWGKIWQNVFVLKPFLLLVTRYYCQIIFCYNSVCLFLFGLRFFPEIQAFSSQRKFTFLASKFLLTYLPSIFWNGANKCPIVSLALSIIFQFKFSWIFSIIFQFKISWGFPFLNELHLSTYLTWCRCNSLFHAGFTKFYLVRCINILVRTLSIYIFINIHIYFYIYIYLGICWIVDRLFNWFEH